jgi:hypothetical protein
VRRLHQQLILGLLETIKEAQKQELYVDCQEGALAIIEFVNQQEGEGTRTVELLNEYINLLDQVRKGEANNNVLRKQLFRIESCIKTELKPNKYKALFLPYYDNTWESMRSVYEAFAQDPLFETEVVIIPIIRNTNEGLKFVWRDYLTPTGISNTHFDQYSFEIDQPDVVFYNQPYDGVNIPKFQSANIRKYARLMVYIPYYGMKLVGSRTARRERTRRESIHRCDLFIAQSKSYCEHYLKKSSLYSKVLIHGNPKCDALYAAKHKGKYTRYPKWEEAIGNRRAILFNTHYSYMMDGVPLHPGVIRLLEDIIKYEDLFLIWRPHPQAFLMKLSSQMEALLELAYTHERMIVDRTPNILSAFMYAYAFVSLFPSSLVMDALFLDLPTFIMGLLDDRADSSISDPSFYTAVSHEDISKSPPDSDAGSEAVRQYVEECIYKPLDLFLEEVRSGKDSRYIARQEFRIREFPTQDGTVGNKILESVKMRLSNETL